MIIPPPSEEDVARAVAMDALLKEAMAAFNAMPDLEKAIHRLEQRRSFVHGLAPKESPLTRAERDAIIDHFPEYVVLNALRSAQTRIATLEAELAYVRARPDAA